MDLANAAGAIALVERLGIKVSGARLLSLIPLASVKASEFNLSHLETLLKALDVAMDDELKVKLVESVNNADTDDLSELLGQPQYFDQFSKYLTLSKERVKERIAEENPFVPIRCEVCLTISGVDRFTVPSYSEQHEVYCTNCGSSKSVNIKDILDYGE